MSKRYEISDSGWECIEALFPTPKTGRPPKWDNKTMLNAILWLARNGSTWENFPAAIRLTKVFTVDSANGVMADADLENPSIDSTAVKAHPQCAGAKKGL